jgi:hypothetical protein
MDIAVRSRLQTRYVLFFTILFSITVKSVLTVICLQRSSVLCGHSVFVPLQHIP